MPHLRSNTGRAAVLAAAAAALMAAVVISCCLAYVLLNRPTGRRESCIVHIEPGMGARQIGRRLQDLHLIRSAGLFEWSARLRRIDHRLEAGNYRIDGRSSTAAILHHLLEAPLELTRVTIPEGLTRREIAGLLQRQGVADSSRFADLTGDAELTAELGVPAVTLEGYLFPETYFLDPDATEEEIARRMVAQFHSVFGDSLYLQLGVLGMSLHEAVTLASIVELEAQAPSERPTIAAIFHRRLSLNRRLESCATVEFALGAHRKRLTNADLRVVSPYNTYRHSGLPPGPIGNPGLASILAALYPPDTEYLYFVARGDGTHQFSRTNREHVAAKGAIRLAQQRRARAEAGR